jgi:NarL family two-component system response regulator LiaR
VRSGLTTFIRVFPDLELVGQAANGREAVLLCEKERPDVVLMDLMMPEMDGATATREIRARFPGVQVIALTSFKEDEMVRGALQAGAIGYLLKDVGLDELAAAVRAAKAGKPALGPEAAEVLLRTAHGPAKLGHDLSPREREVLALMTQGLNNREIADRLVIGETTVKFHVRAILSKLGARGRAEAAVLAVQHHLVG